MIYTNVKLWYRFDGYLLLFPQKIINSKSLIYSNKSYTVYLKIYLSTDLRLQRVVYIAFDGLHYTWWPGKPLGFYCVVHPEYGM